MLGGIAILFLIVALGGVLANVRGWYYSFRYRAKQPCCAVCRYPVRGLQSFMCPECGGDLREAGILTPAFRVMRPLGFVSKAAYWTLVVAFIAFIATVFGEFIPGVRRLHFTRVMTVTTPVAGLDGLYLTAEGAVAPGMGTTPSATLVTLDLPATSGPGGRFSISNEGSHSWSWFTPGRESAGRGDPTPQAISEWLVACNVVWSSSGNFPSQLLDATNSAFSWDGTTFINGPVTVSSSATSSWEGPAEWFQYASVMFWGALWALGCYLLWKSGERARERARAKVSDPDRGVAALAPCHQDAATMTGG